MKYYQISPTGYPIISPIVLEGFIQYDEANKPQELIDAEAAQNLLEIKLTYEKELERYMNKKANERGYDTIHTSSLRAALIDSPFHDEGVAYGTWMDACNTKGYEILAQVQAGTIALPTVEEFIAMLPVLVLP